MVVRWAMCPIRPLQNLQLESIPILEIHQLDSELQELINSHAHAHTPRSNLFPRVGAAPVTELPSVDGTAKLGVMAFYMFSLLCFLFVDCLDCLFLLVLFLSSI